MYVDIVYDEYANVPEMYHKPQSTMNGTLSNDQFAYAYSEAAGPDQSALLPLLAVSTGREHSRHSPHCC